MACVTYIPVFENFTQLANLPLSDAVLNKISTMLPLTERPKRGRGRPRGSKTRKGGQATRPVSERLAARASRDNEQGSSNSNSGGRTDFTRDDVPDDNEGGQIIEPNDTELPTSPSRGTRARTTPAGMRSIATQEYTALLEARIAARPALESLSLEWLSRDHPALSNRASAIEALNNDVARSQFGLTWLSLRRRWDLGQSPQRDGHISMWKTFVQHGFLPRDVLGYKFHTMVDYSADGGNWC